ncbi:P-loop containing nucleoside triphosphate hydrolase protein [Obelidium mucronatum]|nr:P-loop containing nucleoside triphosphate hydrolase protein [Obelidium mucronatum]
MALNKAVADYRQVIHRRKLYFKDKSDGWILGELVSDVVVEASAVRMQFQLLTSGKTHEVKIPLAALQKNADDLLPPLKNPDFMDNVDDLSVLSYLHEAAVFWGIKNRFIAQQIYTYSGMVLLAMNPFEKVDIYTPDIMKAFSGKKRDELMPHIYGIAEECYRAMLEGKNQSVIISGESGAGKTQSTRYVMQYFALADGLSSSSATLQNTSQLSGSPTEEAVLASNPILEAFGNAKTTRNDNSSRFGKFVQLFFSDPLAGNVRITGAKVRTYLLERSRLIFQPATERNYHIFYQLCAAAPAAEKKIFGLESWESFYYLNQGNAGVLPTVDDIAEFKFTQDALSTVGVAVSVQWDIFRLCAGLLHIGNISVTSKGESATISEQDPSLLKACELLGIHAGNFAKWITKKAIHLKGDGAVVARDSVTKVIYTKLFDWLVAMINKKLQLDSNDKQQFIGVLDIYGFEHFAVNSFEQFCINYANEKLQQEFNAHVFRFEQDEYMKEGIQWTRIQFSDNLSCIQLIESKLGVLSLLDEESRLQNGTDANFVVGNTANYEKARFGGGGSFTVKHYAVDNMDSMSDELKSVLSCSTNEFLRQVLEGVVGDDTAMTPPSPTSGKVGGGKVSVMKSPTLGSMFKASLADLMETMRQTESHFEGAMVLSQLQACGVLETIRISNAGYPNKLEYTHFAARYCVLVNSRYWDHGDKKELTQIIVTSVLKDESKFQFGKTKVFFKSGQIASFENRRKERVRHLVVFVQKNVRRGIDRRKFLAVKEAVVGLQSLVRGYLARQELNKLRQDSCGAKLKSEQNLKQCVAAVRIQSAWRGWLGRRAAQRNYELIVLLQSVARRRIAVSELKSLKKENVVARKQAQEKTTGLEAKIIALSQTLQAKVSEYNKLQSRVGSYESQISNWKDKYGAASHQISALKDEIVVLKAERDTYKEERDRFSQILSNAIHDGVSATFQDFPFINNSNPTNNGATTVATYRLGGSSSNKRRPSATNSVEPSDNSKRGSGHHGLVRDSIISSLKTENESLKRMVENIRYNSIVSPSSSYSNKRKTLRAQSIFENDVVADAERERRARNRYSGIRVSSEARNSIRMSLLKLDGLPVLEERDSLDSIPEGETFAEELTEAKRKSGFEDTRPATPLYVAPADGAPAAKKGSRVSHLASMFEGR